MRLGRYIGAGAAGLAVVVFAVLYGRIEPAEAARAVTGTGIGVVNKPSNQSDPGCGAGSNDSGQPFEFCTSFRNGINPAKIQNVNEWLGLQNAFVNGCGEGCVLTDASFTDGDNSLHQAIHPNDSGVCVGQWGDAAPGLNWVAPRDAGSPWQPVSCNPISIGQVQSQSTFGGSIKAPHGYVVEFSGSSPNIVFQDNSYILYSKTPGGICLPSPYLDYWACEWAQGHYPGQQTTWSEIDLTLGVLNLFTGTGGLIASTNYGGNIPLSCNPNSNPPTCRIDAVIIPAVSIQIYVNGISMGASGRIISPFVPVDEMFFWVGVPTSPPGPGTWAGIVDQLWEDPRVCDCQVSGCIPHC